MADTMFGPRHLCAGFEVLFGDVGAVAFGPFEPGEEVEFAEVLVAWGVTGAVAASIHNVFVDVRFCSGQPKTVAEAQRGRSPWSQTVGLDPASPRITCGMSEVSGAGLIPVEWKASEAERFCVVLLSTDDADESFSAFVGLFRGRHK